LSDNVAYYQALHAQPEFLNIPFRRKKNKGVASGFTLSTP
jgi:hypothetical protein